MKRGGIMVRYWTYIRVSDDSEITFVVQLKNRSRFVLNDCYFTIYKELFKRHPDSDYFLVELVGQYDERLAEEKLKRAIELFMYITGVPYEAESLRRSDCIDQDWNNIECSSRKKERIEAIDAQYKRVRKKKDLLINVLKLYAMSLKFASILSDVENAYFSDFRIIEKIVKDEFGIEKNSINKGADDIKSMLNQTIQGKYGIKMAGNKLDKLSGNYSKQIFDEVFSDIYAKIAWYCTRKNIDYDEEILSSAVKIRNKLAHDDNVNIMFDCDEYKLISQLAHEFIHYKFFDNIQKCYLEARGIE